MAARWAIILCKHNTIGSHQLSWRSSRATRIDSPSRMLSCDAHRTERASALLGPRAARPSPLAPKNTQNAGYGRCDATLASRLAMRSNSSAKLTKIKIERRGASSAAM